MSYVSAVVVSAVVLCSVLYGRCFQGLPGAPRASIRTGRMPRRLRAAVWIKSRVQGRISPRPLPVVRY